MREGRGTAVGSAAERSRGIAAPITRAAGLFLSGALSRTGPVLGVFGWSVVGVGFFPASAWSAGPQPPAVVVESDLSSAVVPGPRGPAAETASRAASGEVDAAEVAELSASLQRLIEENYRLRKANEELDEKLRYLRGERNFEANRMNATLLQNSAYKEQNEKLRIRNERMAAELDRLEAELKQVRETATEKDHVVAALKQRIEEQQKQLELLVEERPGVILTVDQLLADPKQVGGTIEMLDYLRQKNKALKEEKKRLEEEWRDRLARRGEEFRKQLEELRGEVEAQKEIVARMKARKEAVEKELAAAGERAERDRREWEQEAQAQRTKLEAKIAALEQEVREKEAALKEAGEARKPLEAEIGELKKAVAEKEDALKEARLEAEGLRRDLAGGKRDVARTRREWEERVKRTREETEERARAERTKLEAKIGELEKAVAEKEDALKEARLRLDEKEAALARVRERMAVIREGRARRLGEKERPRRIAEPDEGEASWSVEEPARTVRVDLVEAASVGGADSLRTERGILSLQKESDEVVGLADHLKESRQALADDEARIHYNMGNIFYRLGRYQRAAREYRQAVALRPDDADAHYNLAFVSGEHLEDYETALSHYRSYLQLKPDAEDAVLVKEKIMEARLYLKSHIASSLEEDLREMKRRNGLR